MKTTTQRSLRFHLVLLTALVSGGIAWADDLSTMVAKRHPVDLTLPFEATVEAMTQTTLTSQVSGRVIDMQVDVGQPVRKGDLLLRIDAREASEMAAGATAQYVNAKANYDRLKNLHQQKFISAAALDKAKADFEAAVLHAVNGGGQNLARAMLTGALVGGQVGLSGIPARFIDGLEGSAARVELARQLAAQLAT